ncbi:MAG: hypothetical protein EOO39_45345, partial [Cytophagaceae bacterium]
MIFKNTYKLLKIHDLPKPSNDNLSERYLALDLEPLSLDAKALVEDLCFHLRSFNLNRYKFRREVRLAIEAIVADLLATAENGRELYAFRSMATGSFTNGHVGHGSFKSALGAMTAAGMVEVMPARQYGSDGQGERGIATRFRATAVLHEWALGYGVTAATWAMHFQQKPRLGRIRNPLLLRSSSVMFKGRKLPGRAIPFARTPRIKAMEEQVNDINAFLATQDLYLAGYSHRHFHRIFGMGDY